MRPAHWPGLSTIRRQRLRRGAITATLLFATLQIASIAHLASAHHQVCAELGEDIESDDADAGRETAPSRDRSAAVEAGQEHRYAHCPVLSLYRTGVSPLAQRVVWPAATVALAASGEATSLAADRSQTFRLAPKASPPGI